jgi:hypothetical protein
MNRRAMVLLAAAASVAFGSGAAAASRVEQLVEANVAGVHAFQVKLSRAAKKGDPACYGAPGVSDAALDAIEAHQAALLAADPAQVRAWASGEPSSFDPKPDLEPLLATGLAQPAALPVNVFTAYLSAQGVDRPRAHLRAVANLYQTVLEVERDGDRLQELFRFYIALGLPVYVGQFRLAGTDADLLAAGETLAGRACDSPVGLSAAEWQIAGRKIWNWGEKNLHLRDARVLADELLTEVDVLPLVPRMRALKAQRVAVIGHSFTMALHWSTPSSFVPTVTAMFARENPGVVFRQFEGGGMTSTRAARNFLADALAWKPDVVLLVLLNRTDEDLDNFAKLGRAFRGQGARVYSFDDVHDPDTADPARLAKEWQVGREAGIEIVEVGDVLAQAPDRARFFCLDRLHMTEPYHRLMAREWLKLLTGARAAKAGD